MSLGFGRTTRTVAAAAVDFVCGLVLAAELEPDDAEAVTAAFQRLQRALRDKSAAALEAMPADITEPVSNWSIALAYIRMLEHKGDAQSQCARSSIEEQPDSPTFTLLGDVFMR